MSGLPGNPKTKNRQSSIPETRSCCCKCRSGCGHRLCFTPGIAHKLFRPLGADAGLPKRCICLSPVYKFQPQTACLHHSLLPRFHPLLTTLQAACIISFSLSLCLIVSAPVPNIQHISDVVISDAVLEFQIGE